MDKEHILKGAVKGDIFLSRGGFHYRYDEYDEEDPPGVRHKLICVSTDVRMLFGDNGRMLKAQPTQYDVIKKLN